MVKMLTVAGDGEAGTAERRTQRLAPEADEGGGAEPVRGVAGARVVGVTIREGAVGNGIGVGEELPGADRVALKRAGRAEVDELAEVLQGLGAGGLGDDFAGLREGLTVESVGKHEDVHEAVDGDSRDGDQAAASEREEVIPVAREMVGWEEVGTVAADGCGGIYR